MKKLFFRYTTGFIPLMLSCSSIFAQESGFSTTSPGPYARDVAYNNKPKPRNLHISQGSSTITINARAVKDFSKNYKSAANAFWFEIKDGYLAKFEKDGVIIKVFYDRKGRLLGNIQSYFEDKLARNIRHQVKSTYYDHKIFYIHQLTAGNKTIYLLKLEGQKDWKTIKLDEGEMEETESFTKSN